jgi:heterotetrameric sarcosine oxidase delta subunit
MIRITCPYCGLRNSNEFAYIGEARPRPEGAPEPPQWRAYLYTRRNPAGWTTESWFHRYGCRKLIVAERHTVTNEVRSTRLGEDGVQS